MHWATFFGIPEVVAGLIEMECYDMNKDALGSSPLVWATGMGTRV